MQINHKDSKAFKNKKWSSYATGFGKMEDEEFWLGLEKVHQITTSGKWSLDVELTGRNVYTGNEQKTITLTWKTFEISNEADGYRLTIGEFQNNGNSNVPDRFNYHNGLKFSTVDRDNDKWEGGNCASSYGWWFNSCAQTMLNDGNGNGPSYGYHFDQSKMILKGNHSKKLGIIFQSKNIIVILIENLQILLLYCLFQMNRTMNRTMIQDVKTLYHLPVNYHLPLQWNLCVRIWLEI